MVTVLRLSKLLSYRKYRNREIIKAYDRQSISKGETIPYNLCENDLSSNHFYRILKDVAQEVLQKIMSDAEEILHQYAYFLEEDLHEPRRSAGEYAIEFLTIGITWRCYSKAVLKTPRAVLPLLTQLYKLRNRNSRLKSYIDTFRGKITETFIAPHLNHDARTEQVIIDKDNFRKLIIWLTATGEFKDEVKRLDKWTRFFATITAAEENNYLGKACDLAEWFYGFSKVRLGVYTRQVSTFIENNLSSHKGSEDALFCGKSEVEYHINMIASEIMNQGFRDTFHRTNKKTVLVPGCMRSQADHLCKALHEGDNITCTHCTANCNVNRITSLGEKKGFKTFIVPHSSGFTKWLKRFADQNENGIVAVACTLNIVAGGYEMRELNIPSQCVLLDYCGCKKHWHSTGVPTDVNDEQLMNVLKK